ncbi:hypothetical protein MKEN_01001600 [Mycena kentingensis (nom. inval.)]|nr:hypothetical protein MKEN_01001600 [Mycena kentingensis (nom. inval.)]
MPCKELDVRRVEQGTASWSGSGLPSTVTMQLLDLPPEILLACVCDLPFDDLANLLCITNQRLHTLLHDSVVIRYRAELEAADVDENPHALGTAVIADRREALRQREERWLHLTPLSTHTIRPDFVSASIYDVTGELYFVGDAPDAPFRPPLGLRYTRTSPPSVAGPWGRIASEAQIVDFAASLPVNDLIALVTCRIATGPAPVLAIYVELVQFSTGERHPLAQEPELHIVSTPAENARPSVSVEIVDNVLAISLMYWASEDREYDRLHLFHWKLGKRLIAPRYSSNNGLVFLTPGLVAVPNTDDESLEVFTVPDAPPAGGEELPTPVVHAFSLPRLKEGHLILSFHCRGCPNPQSSATEPVYAPPSRAKFTSRGSESLLLFTFNTTSTDLNAVPQEHLFVVRRSIFVTIIRSLTSERAPAIPIPWSYWGPLCARFLDASNISRRYITTTCGQRLVCISRAAQDVPAPIRVLCFNEHIVRQHEDDYGDGDEFVQRERSMARLIAGDPRHATEPHPDYTVSKPALATFANPSDLVSHVPYIEVVTKGDTYDFGAVVINDENIIGVRFGGPGLRSLESLQVLHFG